MSQIPANESNFDSILEETGVIPKGDPPPKAEEPNPWKEKYEASQLSNQKMSKDFGELRSSYDKTNNQLVKLMGYVEGKNVATVNPETGEINPNAQPDTSAADIKTLQTEITKEEKALNKSFNKEDIDSEEYREGMAEIREKEQRLIDMKVKAATPASKAPAAAPAEPKAAEETKETAYNRLSTQYEDTQNKDSSLYKAMNDVYNQNPTKWSKANYNNGTGDPTLYAELINEANKNLQYSDKYVSPKDKGFSETRTQKSNLSTEQTQNLINGGMTKKEDLREINNTIGKWEKTSEIQMEY